MKFIQKSLKIWNTQASRSIPSKGAAGSYLALVYLTQGEWQKAYDESKSVIDNKATYGYELDSDFQNLFNADKIDASKEPIFALDYNNVEAPNNGYDQIAPMTGIRGDEKNGGGWSVAVPSLAVYDTWDADDYRRAVSLTDGAVIKDTLRKYTDYTVSGHKFAKNRPYIAKYTRYPGPFARGNGRATSHNYSMLRYAEVLLIAAETAVELGKTAEALTYINQVRARARKGGTTEKEGKISANAKPADLTTVTVADVLEERRLEFAFECKRWYDIVRRKMGDAPYNVFGATGLEGEKPNFTKDDYLLPIPNDELIRNTKLTQNPGY